MGTVALLKGWPACNRRACLPLYALPLTPCFCTVPKRVPILGTFLPFWALLGPYLYFRVPIFSVLAKIMERMSIQSSCAQQ